MSTHHTKTVVVDFDDTIAFTYNRDWENATPNVALIDKLNELYDSGWTIHIVTARGQLSCNGDSEAASKKYRKQIESWLKKHCVGYTDLSFKKKLAAYYIDDKALTPEQFVKDFQREPLQAGWSGAEVYYDRAADAVFKTAENSLDAVEWYRIATEKGIATPEIHSIIGKTIRMERLPEYRPATPRKKIDQVLDILVKFKNTTGYYTTDALRQKYVERVTENGIDGVLSSDEFDRFKKYMQWVMTVTPPSFNHGDMSITNVMGQRHDQTKPSLIDPIFKPDLYQSYVIDLAKLSTSFIIGGQDSDRDILLYSAAPECLGLFGDPVPGAFVPEKLQEVILVHEAAHLSRVFRYAPLKSSTVSAPFKPV